MTPTEPEEPHGHGLEALTLFIGALGLMILFPSPGPRQWDGLMSATVLAHWPETPVNAILFFAHPLVLPLTRLFDLALPYLDRNLIVSLREATFAACAATLIYLFAVRLWGRLPAALTALAYLLPIWHWTFASWGEEKDTLMFFSLLFLLPFFHLRGDVAFTPLERLPRTALRVLLGLALALAFMVHLGAALLVPFTILASIVAPGPARNRRTALADLVWILAAAGGATVAFYGVVVIGVNQITTLAGARAWFFAYHQQFFGLPNGGLQQLVRAYMGFRSYLVGGLPAALPAFECGLAIGITLAVSRAALRHRPSLAAAGLIFVAIQAAHFFLYEPWDPEAWAPSSFIGLILLGIAVFDGALPLRRAGTALWALGLLLLLAADIDYYRDALASYDELQAEASTSPWPGTRPLEARYQAHNPAALMVRIFEPRIPTNAILTVGQRHLANAFLIYTPRRPVVAKYLDRTEAQLVTENQLTNLSLLFYRPPVTSAAIAAAARAGRPVYHVSARTAELDAAALLAAGLTPRTVLEVSGFRLYALEPTP